MQFSHLKRDASRWGAAKKALCEQTNSNHVKYDTRFSIKRVKHMVMLLFLPLHYLKLKFIVCAEEAWPGIVSTGKLFVIYFDWWRFGNQIDARLFFVCCSAR